LIFVPKVVIRNTLVVYYGYRFGLSFPPDGTEIKDEDNYNNA